MNNYAESCGGAIYLIDSASLRLENCVLKGNRTRRFGGAICLEAADGSADMVNSTFHGNHALLSGGAEYKGGTATLDMANCVFSQNVCDNNPNIYCNPLYLSVSYSDVYEATLIPGQGNINSDPLLATPGYWDFAGTPNDLSDDVWHDGDCHLQASSPCIDAADGDVAPQFDCEGGPRYDNQAVPNTGRSTSGNLDYTDMGAYERRTE